MHTGKRILIVDDSKTMTAIIFQILKDANYRGYVVLEYEESDPFGEIPRILADLRKLIQA